MIATTAQTNAEMSRGITLLNMPGEIRMQIYDQLFLDTRLYYGLRRNSERYVGSLDHNLIKWKPHPDALALLYTNKQINIEIGHSWVEHVLFSFSKTAHALDLFTKAKPELISRIRYVHLETDSTVLTTAFSPGPTEKATAGPALLAFLFPELQLEILSLDCRDPWTDGLPLEILSYRRGWKRLALIGDKHYLGGASDLTAMMHVDNEVLEGLSMALYEDESPARSSLAKLLDTPPTRMNSSKAFRRIWSRKGGETETSQSETGSDQVVVAIKLTGAEWEDVEPDWARVIRGWTNNNTWAELRCFERFRHLADYDLHASSDIMPRYEKVRHLIYDG